MKQFVMAGTIIGALAIGAPVIAQTAKGAQPGHTAPNSQPTTAEEPSASSIAVQASMRVGDAWAAIVMTLRDHGRWFGQSVQRPA